MRLVKKRTKTLDADDTKTLLSLVESAEKRDQKFFDLCARSRKWLKGDQWDSGKSKKKNMARMTINLMHAHARSLLPTIFFQDPYIEAYPNDKVHHEGSAQTWEGLINHINERTGYKRITKEVVFDSIVYPEAWKKWVIIKEADSEEIETGEEDVKELDGVSGGLTEDGQAGPLDNTSLSAIVGLRVSPEQVITDSDDRNHRNSRFVAIRYRKLLSEIEADPKYTIPKDIKDRLQMPGATQGILPGGNSGGNLHPKVNELGRDEPSPITRDIDPEVTIYEVWVYNLVKLKLYKQVVTLLKEYREKPIRQPLGWEEFVGKYVNSYPINRLVLNPIPDSKPISELATFKSMSDALNWLSSRMISMVENQKQVSNFYSGNAKNAEKAKIQIESDNIREYIEANEVGKPVIEVQPTNPVPRDLYELLQILMGFIQQVTGFGMNRRGESGIRTAREAAIVEQGTQIKTNEKVDAVSDFIQEDMEILARIVRSVADKDYTFYLRGESGPLKWKQFTKADADWSPDLRVRPRSFIGSVEQERQQSLMAAMNTGIQLFQIYGPKIRLDVVYRRLLEELNIPNPSSIMSDVIPDEILQMVEIIMMSFGQEAPVEANQNHQIHRKTIADFLSSDVARLLPPDAVDRIQQHDMQHAEYEEQNSSVASKPNTENPFGANQMRESSGRGPQPKAADTAYAEHMTEQVRL